MSVYAEATTYLCPDLMFMVVSYLHGHELAILVLTHSHTLNQAWFKRLLDERGTDAPDYVTLSLLASPSPSSEQICDEFNLQLYLTLMTRQGASIPDLFIQVSERIIEHGLFESLICCMHSGVNLSSSPPYLDRVLNRLDLKGTQAEEVIGSLMDTLIPSMLTRRFTLEGETTTLVTLLILHFPRVAQEYMHWRGCDSVFYHNDNLLRMCIRSYFIHSRLDTVHATLFTRINQYYPHLKYQRNHLGYDVLGSLNNVYKRVEQDSLPHCETTLAVLRRMMDVIK